jgi:enoyl-CoA hydratase/carnithine racemase
MPCAMPCLTIDLIHAARAMNQEDDIGCIVLTGSEKCFAAGADISEMSQREFTQVYQQEISSDELDLR